MGLRKLNRFNRRTQSINSVDELLDLTAREVQQLGYDKACFYLPNDTNPQQLKVFSQNPKCPPYIEIQGDRLIAELVLNDQPIVIEDVMKDPRTNRDHVAKDQRSLIYIPLHFPDESFGIFNVGTFGDQGCLVPDSDGLEYLIGLGHQISIALGRLRHRASVRQTNLRLTKVQKMENLGLLASGVVHEFNNMLTVIGININAAKMFCAEEAAKELDIATEAANRIRDLSRQLLSIGRVDDTRKALNVNDTVLHIGALLGKVLPKDIEITMDLDAEIPLVMATVEQMNQVILNLSLNAKDAMPNGGKLKLRTSYQDDEVLMEVQDTGTGIQPRVLDRIFEPFFTTKEYKLGSGLGLSVVQGLVESLDGRIECKSQVGAGTTFSIYLPSIEGSQSRSPMTSTQ